LAAGSTLLPRPRRSRGRGLRAPWAAGTTGAARGSGRIQVQGDGSPGGDSKGAQPLVGLNMMFLVFEDFENHVCFWQCVSSEHGVYWVIFAF
jgi:hypothetical protein